MFTFTYTTVNLTDWADLMAIEEKMQNEGWEKCGVLGTKGGREFGIVFKKKMK